MLITDTTICKNCDKEINWYYQIPEMLTLKILDVDKIPRDKTKVFRCIHNKDNIYTLTCYCSECGNSNTFKYESEHKLCID